MSHGILRYLCLLLFKIVIAFALVSGISPAPVAAQSDAAPDSANRVAELRAQIASLEAQLRAVRAAQRRAKKAAALTPVRTADAGAAGEKAQAGGGGEESAAFIERVIAAVNNRDGRTLFDEISAQLQARPGGVAVLHDLLDHLDQSRSLALAFSIEYRNRFGLMNLGMLHTDQVARFAHYYLAATRENPRAITRGKLYEYIPLILEFYPGRYPDLEAALKADIDRQLALPEPNFRVLDSAMASLKHYPSTETMRKLLWAATTYNRVLAICTHLARRNDADATRVLVAYIQSRQGTKSQHQRLAFNALARMNHVEAYNAMQFFLSKPAFSTLAVQGHFSVQRDADDVDPADVKVAVDYLNSKASIKDKQMLIRFLEHRNRAVLAALQGNRKSIHSQVVRLLIPEEGAKGRASEGSEH